MFTKKHKNKRLLIFDNDYVIDASYIFRRHPSRFKDQVNVLFMPDSHSYVVARTCLGVADPKTMLHFFSDENFYNCVLNKLDPCFSNCVLESLIRWDEKLILILRVSTSVLIVLIDFNDNGINNYKILTRFEFDYYTLVDHFKSIMLLLSGAVRIGDHIMFGFNILPHFLDFSRAVNIGTTRMRLSYFYVNKNEFYKLFFSDSFYKFLSTIKSWKKDIYLFRGGILSMELFSFNQYYDAINSKLYFFPKSKYKTCYLNRYILISLKHVSKDDVFHEYIDGSRGTLECYLDDIFIPNNIMCLIKGTFSFYIVHGEAQYSVVASNLIGGRKLDLNNTGIFLNESCLRNVFKGVIPTFCFKTITGEQFWRLEREGGV